MRPSEEAWRLPGFNREHECFLCGDWQTYPQFHTETGLVLCRACNEEENAKEQRFRSWLLDVDRYLGMASSTGPDFLWRDRFDAGETAEDAARAYMEELRI